MWRIGKYHLELCRSKYAEYRSDFDTPADQDLVIAKTRLVAERAKQKCVTTCSFAEKLLRRGFVEKFHSFNHEVVEQRISETVVSIADKISGLGNALDIVVVLTSEINATLNDICDGVSGDRFAERYPELCTPLITEECRTSFDEPDPKEAFRSARLEQLK